VNSQKKLIRMVFNPSAVVGAKLRSDCNCGCHTGRFGMTHFRSCCIQNPKYDIPFPELDEYNTPKEKLPNCPNCGEDELGVIHERYMMCYACKWRMELLEDTRK